MKKYFVEYNEWYPVLEIDTDYARTVGEEIFLDENLVNEFLQITKQFESIHKKIREIVDNRGIKDAD